MSELVARIQEAARMIEGTLGPDGDWVPVLAWEGGDGFGVAPLEMPDGDANRDMVGDAIAELLQEVEATEAVFLCSAWSVSVKGEASDDPLSIADHDDPLDGVMPRNHPNRQEVLIVTYITRDGEAKGWLAKIRRKDGVPKLGRFIEGPGEAMIDGRFADALRKGVSWS